LKEQCSLNPGTVVPVVIRILVDPGNDAVFYSICGLLCALEFSLGILELDSGECRNPLKFLIVKNVFLGALLSRSPLYPGRKRAIYRVKGYSKSETYQAREEIKPDI